MMVSPDKDEDAKLRPQKPSDHQQGEPVPQVAGRARLFLTATAAAVGAMAVLAASGVLLPAGFGAQAPAGGREGATPAGGSEEEPPPPLADLRIAAGGGLWPPFAPDVANYEVELDAAGLTGEEAPLLELELASPKGLRPLVRVDGTDLRALAAAGRPLRHAVRLHRLARRSRSAARYQLVFVEARALVGAAELYRNYSLRVLRPVEPAHWRQPDEDAPQPAAPARALGEKIAANRALAVVPTSQTAVGIALVDGSCTRAAGPFRSPPRVSALAGRLGLWSAEKQHVLCFSGRSGSSKDQVSFVVTAADATEGQDSSHQPGEFGFGPGVAVSLRPDIETSAIWPLEAGVQSLGLGLGSGESFRALALRTTDGGMVSDTPVVVARAVERRWPIAVQLLNASLGSCSPAPSSDAARFVCRAGRDAVGTSAQFVLVCQDCVLVGEKASAQAQLPEGGSRRAWSVSVLDGSGGSIPTTLDADSEFVSGRPAPWIGWSAPVPGERASKHWIVRLRQAASSSGAEGGKEAEAEEEVDVTEFEVALVAGDGAVPWMLGPAGEGAFRAAGVLLSLLLAAALAASAAVLALSSFGFPAPTLAMLPSLSATACAVQFLALLGTCPGCPKLLTSLCGPLAWAAPGPPAAGLPSAFLALLAVAVLHAGAVLRYIMLNGSGSAKALPHGLVFGAWELRALGLVALPLAAAGAQLLCDATAWYQPRALLGAGLLAGLGSLAVWALRQMLGWFADERVVRVPLPSCPGHRICVDRLCDQLRAVPAVPGPARLLGDWPASPGWCVAPAVAAIKDLEHRGAPAPGGERNGPWGASWPQGPWAQQRAQPVSPRPGGSSYSRQGSTSSCARQGSMGGQGRQGSKASTGSALTCVSEGQKFYKELLSPVFHEHPVRAALEFPYAGSKRPCIAGLVGLPWVDVAVLADTLCAVESLAGVFSLQVHVGQLSGALTGGRLAACFDWGDRQPWRWSADILVKVLLGAYIGAMSSARASAVTAAGLQIFLSVGMAVLAVAALVMQPHAHLVDNIALATAMLAIGVAVAIHSSAELPSGVAPAAMSALVALSLAPIVLALVAACVAAAFAARWRQQDLHDKVLPATVREWGGSAKGGLGNHRGDKYFGIWCEDASSGAPEVDDASSYSRAADIVLLSLGDGVGATKSRITLPAEMKIPLVHQELLGQAGQGQAAKQAASGRIRVPVPASMLFTPAQDGLDRASATPFAALLTPQGGQLLYRDGELNGGINWNEALQCFFQDGQGLAKEAEAILRQHERDLPAEASGEGLLAVLEFSGPMESSSQPSWRTCR